MSFPPAHTRFTHQDHGPLDAPGIIFELQKRVLTQRVRVKEFFRDFDKGRKGLIHESKFRTGLSTAKFDLTSEQINTLSDFYRIEPESDQIKYIEFCKDLDQVFTLEGLERCPTQTLLDTTPLTSKFKNHLSDEEEAHVDFVLSKIHEVVKKRRIYLKPYFQDFQNNKNSQIKINHVTQVQFAQVLSKVGGAHFELSETDLDVLTRKYLDIPSQCVDYATFCQDVENASDLPVDGNMTRNRNNDLPDNQLTPGDAEEALTKLKAEVVNRKIRIHEFFIDFDPLRKGYCSPDVFRRNLRILFGNKLMLTEAEVRALIDRFNTGQAPTTFCWAAFADHVDSVFTVKGLEYAPLYKPGTTFDFLATVKSAPGSKSPLLQSTLDKLYRRTKTQRVITKPMFQPFDKHNRGLVSVSQFRRVMSSMLNMEISDPEFMAILEYYMTTDCLDVRYLDFCLDIDAMEENW